MYEKWWTAIAAVCACTAFGFRPALADSSAPALGLAELHVQSLVYEPLVIPEQADSLFRVLLGREELVGREDPKSAMLTYVRRRNPFASFDGTQPQVPISIDLELEQSWYGPRLDTKQQILDFWAFGILGAALKRGDLVIGMIQWRARIVWPDASEPRVLTGVGICSGPRDALDRRHALQLANKRALWDVAWAITATLDEELKLGIRPTPVGLRPKDYYQISGNW